MNMRKSSHALIEELTSETELAEIAEKVKQTELPASVQTLSKKYDEEVGYRREFLWRWVYTVFDHFTLDSVPDKHMLSSLNISWSATHKNIGESLHE